MARPEFKVTDALRRRVAIAAGSGRLTHEEIAIGLGIARETLEKHFEEELSIGAYERRLDVIEAMYDSAAKGNITSARAYLENAPRAAAPPASADSPEPKPAAVGKKQQANVDATTAAAGTDWEDLLRRAPTTPSQ